MRLLTPFVSLTLIPLLLVAPLPAQTEVSSEALQLRLVDSDGDTVLAGSHSKKGFTFEVSDRSGKGIPDVAIAFRLPDSVATGAFGDGSHAVVAYTDAAGKAHVTDIKWSDAPGVVSLRVTASKDTAHAGILLEQTLATAAALAKIPPALPGPTMSATDGAMPKPGTAMSSAAGTAKASPANPAPAMLSTAAMPKLGTAMSSAAGTAKASPANSAPAMLSTAAMPKPGTAMPSTAGTAKASPVNPAPAMSSTAAMPAPGTAMSSAAGTAKVMPPNPAAAAISSATAPRQPGSIEPVLTGAQGGAPSAPKVASVSQPADPQSEQPSVSVTNVGKSTGAAKIHSNKTKWIILAVAIAGGGAAAMAFTGKGSAASAPSTGSISIGSPTVSIGHP